MFKKGNISKNGIKASHMNPEIYFLLFFVLFIVIFEYFIESINGWIQILESMW